MPRRTPTLLSSRILRFASSFACTSKSGNKDSFRWFLQFWKSIKVRGNTVGGVRGVPIHILPKKRRLVLRYADAPCCNIPGRFLGISGRNFFGKECFVVSPDYTIANWNSISDDYPKFFVSKNRDSLHF